MQSTATRLVGDLAAQSLAAVRVFEKHGIDYCCGGKRPLDEVCAEKGLNVDGVLGELGAAEETRKGVQRDWSSVSLTELIGHIVTTHHEYLRTELPFIEKKLAKVLDAHHQRHGETLGPVAKVFADLKLELELHIQKEEIVLFPAITQTERAVQAGQPWTPPRFGSFGNPIQMMEHEHDSAGTALSEIRRLTNDFALPEGACNTFRALFAGMEELERDLHMHIHLENNILFPRAMAMESLRRSA